MVLFINKSNSYTKDLEILSKMMINIEKNMDIYKTDGTNNSNEDSKLPYNLYTIECDGNDIELNINVYYGNIVIYTNSNIYTDTLIRNLEKILETLDKNNDYKHPVSNKYYKSNEYTMILGENIDTYQNNRIELHRYITTSNNKHDIKRHIDQRVASFIWVLSVFNISNNNNGFLYITEYNNRHNDELYLAQAPATIIYDNVVLFNVNHGTKQINYPSIKQYTDYNTKLLNMSITSDYTYGLSHEIMLCYNNLYSGFRQRPVYYNVHQIINDVNMNDYEIRYANTKIEWFIQITEQVIPSQHELINDVKQDICFVSKSPLYGTVYILKVGKKKRRNYCNESYILINSYIYHKAYYLDNTKLSKDFHIYFNKLSKYTIIDVHKINYQRSEYEAIELIPITNFCKTISGELHMDNYVSMTKKKIMKHISEFSLNLQDNNTTKLNIQISDVLYIGIIGDLYDTKAIYYTSTGAVLFKYIFNKHT